MMNNKSLVLLVDDNPYNLQVLGSMLKEHGCHLAFAQNGVGALEFVKKKLPDLILLDIMMPDMDGFEVCQKLKQNVATQDIPIIFLTAKTGKEEVIEGLELGAVDYVTKPFHIKELITRVTTHLELKAAKDLIILQKEELNQTVKKLKQANATKDKFFSIISHDLKNLFNALIGLSGLVADKRIETEKRDSFVKVLQQTSEKGHNLLVNLLTWSRSQTGKIEFKQAEFNLKDIAADHAEFSRTLASAKKINIFSDIEETTTVFADKNMLDTVFRNLLSNAIKFTPANGSIKISSKQEGDFVEISISDTGIGMQPEDIEKLFRIDVDHKTIGTSDEKGTGLGLILCKEFVEKNGGAIWVESEEGKGSQFYIILPCSARR